MEVCLRAYILLCLICSTGLAQVYDITPHPCPAQAPCLTLTQFANASNTSYKNVESAATLMFLSGYHRLEKQLKIENFSTLSMLSNSTSTVIACYNHTNLRIANVGFVSDQ